MANDVSKIPTERNLIRENSERYSNEFWANSDLLKEEARIRAVSDWYIFNAYMTEGFTREEALKLLLNVPQI